MSHLHHHTRLTTNVGGPRRIKTAEEKLFRRREVVRQCQQRYRDRKKKMKEENVDRVQELKNNIAQWYEYQDLLIQKMTMRPSNEHTWQVKVTGMYAMLLRHGFYPADTAEGKSQEQFFQLTFTSDVIVQSEAFPRGPDTLIQQHHRYASLHPNLTNELVSVSTLSSQSSDIGVHFKSTLPIKQRTIAALFPHMVSNTRFMSLVQGKSLVVDVRYTLRFNVNSRIEYISCEMNTGEAWMKLLKDLGLVLQVLNPDTMRCGFIVISDEDIQRAIDNENANAPIDRHASASALRSVKRLGSRTPSPVQQVSRTLSPPQHVSRTPSPPLQLSRMLSPPMQVLRTQIKPEPVRMQSPCSSSEAEKKAKMSMNFLLS